MRLLGWIRTGAATALTVGLVAACGKQSEQLWPSVAYTPGARWSAAPAEQGPQWWDSSISVHTDIVDGTTATVINSLVTDREITVHYRDASGAYQRVTLPPGGSIAVATPPGNVFAII